MKLNLFDYTIDQLTEIYMEKFNQKKYRATQTFKWLYQGVENIYEMSDLPLDLRKAMVEEFEIGHLEVKERRESQDGTVKFLFSMPDNTAIETVLMRYNFGDTVCVSSQVGCRMGCDFCASSKLDFNRNLTAGEIVEQVLKVSKITGRRVSNVVFMGIGEPLDNYDNVINAIRILNCEHGLNIGARHISISTCGLIPRILQLADENIPCTLCISLHASNDTIRNKIMPVNKAYDIKNLLLACKKYIEKTNRRITFEYAMIYGVNDSTRNACELSELLRGMLCHVNLIPINAIEDGKYRRSPNKTVMAFRDALNNRGVTATIRRELGSEIDAACGQLRRKYYE